MNFILKFICKLFGPATTLLLFSKVMAGQKPCTYSALDRG